MKKVIFIDQENWHKIKLNSTEVFFRGFEQKKIKTASKFLLNNTDTATILKYIKTLDFNFSIIIQKQSEIIAATDKIRSFPISYYFDRKKFFLFESYNKIKDIKFDKKINNEQVLFFSMSGYTFDNQTIYKNIKQIKAGNLLRYSKNKISLYTYYSFNKKNVKKSPGLEHELKDINRQVILKLIKSCNGKPIVIPLSAGYDSRFIVSGLKEYGYKDIITFSYGRKRNREVEIAKTISKRLNIPWFFIPYTNRKLKKIIKGYEYQNYERYADSLTSIYFAQDFLAIKHLKENQIIPDNSVIVNGQSGDFISGNHIPNLNYNSVKILEELIKHYIFKHYKLWDKYYYRNKNILFKIIVSFIKNLVVNNENIFKVYEILEYENRQCKYVINGQRLYEYFKYEWRLPLWDNLYLDFWSRVPLKDKLNQRLYKRTIHNTNWSGIWNNIPVNPKSSFENHIKFLRFLLKTFFLLDEKKNWHAFEKKYLNYFIHPLCGYAQWQYWKVIKDKRGFRNSISWETEKYLKLKNIDLEKIIS